MSHSEYTVGRYRASEAAALHWPRTHRADGTVLGAVVCMQHGGHPSIFYVGNGGGYEDEAVALADSGHPAVVPGQGASATLWGNDTAKAQVDDAVTYLGSRLGCRTDRVILVGYSMGFVQVCRWARANLSKVACIAGITPVTNVADIHDRNVGGAATEIETAYGGASPYATAVTGGGVNPKDFAAELNVPIRIWYATDDATATPANVAAFVAAAPQADSVSLGAVGHTVTAASGTTVATWIAAHL